MKQHFQVHNQKSAKRNMQVPKWHSLNQHSPAKLKQTQQGPVYESQSSYVLRTCSLHLSSLSILCRLCIFNAASDSWCTY